MTANKDWLPGNHEALYVKAKQAVAYLTEPMNRIRMGFDMNTPQGQWVETVFMPAYTTFTNAFEVWQNPATRTAVIAATLTAAQQAFTGLFRKFYTGFLFKSGKENRASFWISNFKGRFVYIEYIAVRGQNGEYFGILEVSHNVARYRALEGDKRLLDYSKIEQRN